VATGGQTPGSVGFSTPGGQSTRGGAPGGATPTPLRDKLSINPEDGISVGDTPQAVRNYQRQLRKDVAAAFNALPAPVNDYVIVVPEQEPEEEEMDTGPDRQEDQADVDARREAEAKAKAARELKRRSQALQRDLPTPAEVNAAVLRPPGTDGPQTDLQRAEELVKREMVTMLHYDAAFPVKGERLSDPAPHLAYLEKHPFHQIDDKDMEQVQFLILPFDRVSSKILSRCGDVRRTLIYHSIFQLSLDW